MQLILVKAGQDKGRQRDERRQAGVDISHFTPFLVRRQASGHGVERRIENFAGADRSKTWTEQSFRQPHAQDIADSSSLKDRRKYTKKPPE